MPNKQTVGQRHQWRPHSVLHRFWRVCDYRRDPSDAGPWMRDQVARVKAEGWDYLKLDFLYAGAQVGERYADVTGMEAFHIGMEYLKEAADDAFFLACGAPMLPSLGYADAFRTGADIGFNFDIGPRHEYLRWQTRATMSRSWQNGIWWWVDPIRCYFVNPLRSLKFEVLSLPISSQAVVG